MKSRLFIFFLGLFFSFGTHAQNGHWVFKEIIQGNHFGSTRPPDNIQVDVNGGVIEFSMPQKNECTDRYRFTYRFLQDMHVLQLPTKGNDLPAYRYEFELQPLGTPCYDPDVIGYSNPTVTLSHYNASSGLIGNKKKNNSWNYRYHQEWLSNGGAVSFYPHPGKVYKNVGHGSGTYQVSGPYKKEVEKTLSQYPGMATDYRILIKGQSTMPGKEEDFYYDILFMYELQGGAASTPSDPCDIKAPDCSCCPGTIPVWNFESNKGDCICPEGKVWDRIENKCIEN